MRYRPTFYDRRTKHRFVNAERASSEEELTSDSFIADDEDDDGDEDSSDDEGDDPRNRDRRGRRRRETSLERFEREEREKQRADADADAEAPPPRSGAAAAGAGEKSSAGEKSPPPAPDPEDAGSSDDDAVRAGAGRRRRVSNRRVVLIDDEPDAPAPAPAPAAGSPRPAAPASAPEDSSPSSSPARRRRRSSASLGAEDADPEPQLTPGGRRASARVLGKRRRDTETWNRKLEALREGMRREDDGGDDSGGDGAGFDGDGGSFSGSGGVLDADRDDDLHDFVVFDEDDLAVARARGGWSPESDRYDSDFVSDVSAAEDEDGSEEAEDEWVLCECGATADDGSAMVRCGNPRCEVWQHATCVDVDAEEAARPSFAFFCARCDANGRENAPEPPGKPSPRTRTTGASERKKQTRRRKKQTTRARAPDPEGSNPKPSRSGWREKMIAALRADDPEAVDRCLRAVSWPSARAPRFEGMLARAAEFDAREVAAALLGTTGRPGTGPGPAPGGGKKSVASSRRVGLADLARGDATRSKVARALHVALAAGHVGVAEAIRDAMGPRFPARGRQDPWPKAAGGATLAHSASDNARGDPRAVWLALEAEGEPPRAGDEACAAAAADASRAAAAEAEERARDARDRVGGSEPGPSRAGGVRAVGGLVVVDAPIAARRTLGDYARAGAYAAGVPTPEAFPLGAASAATTSPATTRRRDDSRGPPPPAHDTPAAALGDDAQVTPLMRACAAGPGWEGCVAALLWSAGARGRSRPEGFQGAAASCVAVKESSASESAPHHAARTGAAASLRLLLAALPGAVRAADVGGATPLHHAASAGEAGAIETLVADAGASRCARDDKGWIPLLYADWSEKREAVLVLMSENLQEQLGAMHDIMDSEISRPRVLKALRMLATVPPFYDALNEFVSTRIGLLSGSLSFLLHRRAKVVNFANRRAWLERRIEEHVNRHYAYHRGAWVEEDLYGKSLVASHRAPWRDFRRWCVDAGPARLARQPLMYHFRFAGAHAMGMGQGVERELMERLAADVTGAAARAGDGESEEDAPGGDEGPRAAGGEGGPERWFPSADAPLLAPTSEGSDAYAPPPLPETLPRDVEEQYVVFGRLLGYVVMHKAGPFPVSLANAFLRGLLGEGVEGLSREALAEDLEEMDPQEARSLDIVRGMESDVEALGLTFTAEEEELVFEPEAAREDNTASSNPPPSSRVGKKTVERELCPGGAARAVTSANREEYCALRVARRVKRVAACGAVRFARRGLREMIPHEFLRVFSPAEFACVLGGDADVDVDHLRRHATYLGGYDGDSPQIKWLWRLVARFEPNERSLLLKFATGSSRVPAGGFSKEAGRGSVCVMKVPAGRGPGRGPDGDGDGGAGQFALPTAATCFNTLRLPEYPTYEALEQHVTVALRHGVEGFSFG